MSDQLKKEEDATKKEINKFLKKISKKKNAESYLEYISEKAEEMLNLIESDESERRIKEYLLDLFEEDGYTIDDKQIDEVYTLPSNIKNLIYDLSVDFEHVDDNLNNYIKATTHIGNFDIYTYSDYRLGGCKTGGNTVVQISCKSLKIEFDGDSALNFISDSLHTIHELDAIYDAISKNSKTKIILEKMMDQSNVPKEKFVGLMKFLFLIPKHWNGYIY